MGDGMQLVIDRGRLSGFLRPLSREPLLPPEVIVVGQSLFTVYLCESAECRIGGDVHRFHHMAVGEATLLSYEVVVESH